MSDKRRNGEEKHTRPWARSELAHGKFCYITDSQTITHVCCPGASPDEVVSRTGLYMQGKSGHHYYEPEYIRHDESGRQTGVTV